MSKQIEALKLALAALSSGEDVQVGRVVWTEYDSSLVQEAITAIKEALAQPAQQEPVAFDVWLQECESMTMAVRHGVKFLLMPEESAVRIGTAIQNTTPLQRKSLSYVELMELSKNSGLGPENVSGLIQARLEIYGRAIEAAHGIKE